MKLLYPVAIISFCLIVYSCSRDEQPESTNECTEVVTYNGAINKIIDESCAYTGCHDGGAGIGPGDYNRYGSALLRDLNNGSFRSRVIDQRANDVLGMPPNASTYPESLKDDLTDDELEYILCWLDGGFPEN